MKKKIYLFVVMFIIAVLGTNYEVNAAKYVDSKIDVKYRASLTTIGWQDKAYYDGDTAGFEGKAIPLEMFRAVIEGDSKNIGIKYNGYVKNEGWKNWNSNGVEIGAYKKNLTGIKMELTNTAEYVVQYRVYVSNSGWKDWVNSGKIAGSENGNFIEAIQVKVLTKDLKEQNKIKVKYRICLLSDGWQEKAYYNGETAGKEDASFPLQSIRMVLEKVPSNDIGIEYTTYIKDKGWQAIVGNGVAQEVKGKSITGIKIRLTNASSKYSVQYRVRLKNKGWQNWTKDFGVAGSENGEEIIAYQVKILEDSEYVEPVAKVKYRCHIMGSDWQNKAFYDGETGGDTSGSTSLDAVRMVLENVPQGAGIEYRTYVQNQGWQVSKSNGVESNNYKYPITGIKINLINMKDYVVRYRVYLEGSGWQSWVADGSLAGTEGDKTVKALQVQVIKKSEYKEESSNNIKVKYRTHIYNNDWQANAYYDGATGGKEGSKQYLDSVRMVIENNSDNEGIEYATYAKGIGWTGWRGNGVESNDSGHIITGIKIRLTNTIKYSVKYRLYLEGKGWTSWVQDGTFTGTEGTINAEAIQVKVVKREASPINVKYRVNIQSVGWQEAATYDGDLAGNRKNALTSFRMVLENGPKNIGIKYRAFNQNSGWQSWAQNGVESGKAGENLQALRIELTNTLDYSVKYRVYIQNRGWSNWASDGKIVGEPGNGTNILALEVAVLPEWHIANVSGGQSIANGKYKISPQSKNGQYLTVNGSSNGSNLTLSGNNYSTNQNFMVTYLGNGYYKMVSESSNKYIGINGAGTSNTVNVSQYNDSISINKEWIIKDAGNGYYYIVSDCNYLYLDATNDSNLQVSKATYSGNQLFKFEKVKIELQSGTYGSSGLKVKGDSRGQNLKYYKIGNGPNVFFATFAIHGWEDCFSYDGQELTKIAEAFKDKLIAMQDENLASKWTIYIFPSLNPDGEYYGYTHNGPGRTTLYSAAPKNKGIDMNRCWSTGFRIYTEDRNYNGTQSFQAYEARSLRDFLLSHKAQNGQTVLVDLHGWLNETIGDNGIGSYYRSQFGMSKHISTYGMGYLINWARSNLGSNGRVARSSLVELPEAWSSSQVSSWGYANKYINATINMLRGI